MRNWTSLKAAVIFAAAIAALFGVEARAEGCGRLSQAPVIPDGTKASVEQLKVAHEAVQSYVNSLQAYQDCQEAQIKMAPKTTKPEDLQKMRDAGNAAIEEAQGLAAQYAEQVRVYRARASATPTTAPAPAPRKP
jgi:hypothetical protein